MYIKNSLRRFSVLLLALVLLSGSFNASAQTISSAEQVQTAQVASLWYQLGQIKSLFSSIVSALSSPSVSPETQLAQVAPTSGNVYYISPTGSDSNAGTSAAPWKTFAFAIPKLQPGNSLILKNGTYNGSNSGYPNINCSAGAKNGTASAPITIKAENERMAFIAGTGNESSLYMINCSYWTIDGLHIESADSNNGQGWLGGPLSVYQSSNLIIRRLLLLHANRYSNIHLMNLEYVSNSLIEENAAYEYHRHSIGGPVNNSIFRRNYSNGRGYPNITGGYDAGSAPGGASGFRLYPGSNNIFENNIAERTSAAFDMEGAYGETINNKWLGNISLNNGTGDFSQCRTNQPQNTLIKDLAVINPSSMGSYPRGEANLQMSNITVLKSSYGGIYHDRPSVGTEVCPTTQYSMSASNNLVANSASYGIGKSTEVTGIYDYTDLYQNNPNTYSLTASENTNSKTIDPVLGTCKLWLPDSSPMKRAGKNGADIGANILYAYEGGVLNTGKKLWNTDGSFGYRGAIVPGVNDVAGSSLFDIQNRLNINTNGCAFPASYTGTTPTPTPTPIPTPTPTPTPTPADTTLPGVSISSPSSGVTVSGTTNINATASDNVGVTK